jgi:hypothetical protein
MRANRLIVLSFQIASCKEHSVIRVRKEWFVVYLTTPSLTLTNTECQGD